MNSRSMNTCDQILRIFENIVLVLQKEYAQANTHWNGTLVRVLIGLEERPKQSVWNAIAHMLNNPQFRVRTY